MTISFEKAWEKLEKITKKLDDGNLTLETSLQLYEEGIRYARTCLSLLNEAEKKIEVLNIKEGELVLEEHDPDTFLENNGNE